MNPSIKLARLKERLEQAQQTMIGYPMTCKSTMAEQLAPFLPFVLNNLGDPFVGSNYRLNTMDFEREVISIFADLYHAEPGYRGYVTGGGSEGNFRGLLSAREKYPDGVVYYSQASHYSVKSAIDILGLRSVCTAVDSVGSMSISDLHDKINYARPAIFALNIGTTMTGAIDSLSVRRAFNIYDIPSYTHVDAALSGMILPFLDDAPDFDFRNNIDSIAVSGHKFLGCPFPCGVYLQKTASDSENVEYIGSKASTLFGSRNGLAVLAIWLALQKPLSEFRDEVARCLTLAQYLQERLEESRDAYRSNPWSTTVVFRKPPEHVARKWQLATEGDWAHAIIMPHLRQSDVDSFLSDLEGSITDDDAQNQQDRCYAGR